MLTRRAFLLGAARSAAGIILPTFYEKALAYFENHSEPLIVRPRSVATTLNARLNDDYVFHIGDPDEGPPKMTWREFYDGYFEGLKTYYEEMDGHDEMDWHDLEDEAEDYRVLEVWSRSESSNACAFRYLEQLRWQVGGFDGAIGELTFYECPMPGSDYLGVHAGDAVTVSLLQHELNRLGEKTLIKLI